MSGSFQTLVSALDIHVYSSDTEFNEEKHFKHFCIVCGLNIVLSFEYEDEILKFFSVQMKATEHYFSMVLFLIYFTQNHSIFLVCV